MDENPVCKLQAWMFYSLDVLQVNLTNLRIS